MTAFVQTAFILSSFDKGLRFVLYMLLKIVVDFSGCKHLFATRPCVAWRFFCERRLHDINAYLAKSGVLMR